MRPALAVTNRSAGLSQSQFVRSRKRLGRGLLLPATVVYIVFFLGPTLATFWVSLHRWYAGESFTLIGLKNYANILQDPVYWQSFMHTMEVLVVGGVAIFLISFLFMAALRGVRLRRTLRALVFLPNILPAVAIGIIWGLMLDPNVGLVNTGLRAMHLGGLARPWLGPDLIFPSTLVGVVWIYTGFFTVILLAGVDNIPRDLYDASEVDGANKLQQFWRITLPLSWNVVAVASILWVITAIKVFDFIWALSAVGVDPPTTVWTQSVEMYLTALGGRIPTFDLGYGSAIAVTMVLLVGALVVLLRRLMRREAVEF